MKKALIISNGYFDNPSTLHQRESLIKEFNNLGVSVTQRKGNEVLAFIENGEAKTGLGSQDFIIYLDKDIILATLLEKAGYKLFNSAETVRLCDDKALTYAYLTNNGINMPTTVSSPLMYADNNDGGFVEKVKNMLGLPLIVKKVYGSMGKGVFKVDNEKELYEIFDLLKREPHLYQKKVGRTGTDTRVIVIGGKVVTAMERSNPADFRSNIELGGTGKKVELSESKIRLAETVAKLLKADFLGVDILTDDKEYLCEANSNAFFKGITEVTGVNIAKIYAKYIYDKVYNQ